MKRTVFYSWQSDLPGRTNRNLIQESLTRAIRTIARDEHAGVEPVLDRDTANLAGAPDIAHSILAKIATADLFVADVSIVNGQQQARSTPNPNVLVELGYAVAELGWENVVLVMNTVYGGPEQLPFDLRGRRTVVYELQDGDAPAEARSLLQGRLEPCLRSALSTGATSNLPTGSEAALWWGRWVFSPAKTAGGYLFIREVGPSGFLFELNVHNGAHQGCIESYARILSTDFAYCRIPNGQGQPDGELVFRRGWSKGARTISIEEAARCFSWGGMRAHFGGEYHWQTETLFERGYLNELELSRLYSLVGEGMDALRECIADTSQERDPSDDSIRLVRTGVAGLYTMMESIVLADDAGRMWVAYIDGAVVRYFTNVFHDRQKLPPAIETWRERFQNKAVRYCEPVESVPGRGDEHLNGAVQESEKIALAQQVRPRNWWRAIGDFFRSSRSQPRG